MFTDELKCCDSGGITFMARNNDKSPGGQDNAERRSVSNSPPRSGRTTPRSHSQDRRASSTPRSGSNKKSPKQRRSLAEEFISMQGALASLKAQMASMRERSNERHSGKKTPSCKFNFRRFAD